MERITDMGLLDGRNAIITGSARGLGLAMAMSLLAVVIVLLGVLA